ncbi:Hypothetical protein A7982_00555 [Minicystis rosea]|nr:Hypothetical protein A7982_00555 [Minicystis rosea]
MRAPDSFDVAEYATLSATLAEPSCDRAAVLTTHGLDETSYAALDRHFQDRMSRAMDEEHDGVPPIIVAYAEAFERARAALRREHDIISIERYADATREIQRRGDPLPALARVGISLEQFIRANEHWTRRMLEDPALLTRFRERLR